MTDLQNANHPPNGSRYHASAPVADPELRADVAAHQPDDTEAQDAGGGWKWWLIPVVVVVGAIAGLSVYRIRNQVTETPTTEQRNVLSVEVARANVEQIRALESAEGTVQAVRYKHLTFDVSGDITDIADHNGRQLREGDPVQAGEVLARIDDRELTASLNQAQAGVAEAQDQRGAAMAQVSQARSQVAQARSQVNQAQAQLNQAQTARDLAQTNLSRYRQLYQAGAVAESELDSRQGNFDDAQARVEAARSQVQTAREQVDTAIAQVDAAQQQLAAATARVDTAQAEVDQAQVELEGTRLVAPFDGVVAYLNIRENEQYTPQLVQSRLAGNYSDIVEVVPIVVIDPSQFEVIVDVPAGLGDDLDAGQTALVMNESVSDVGADTLMEEAIARGQVYSVNPAVTPGGRSTQATIRVTQGGDSLRHGDRVYSWIATDRQDDLPVVPLDAIVYREQEPYVFVVDPDTNEVEQRAVELGIASVTARAIASGVQPGDLVVTEGQNRLVDGTPVQIVNNDDIATSPSPNPP
jgi:HlyD family secretion protein